MLIPIRTSIQPRRTPYANYFLIALNVACFLISYKFQQDSNSQRVLHGWASEFMLYPIRPEIWQFVTYAFLHGGLMHLLGNMYFLYLFGNNVNDKLGHVGYTCFYLAGAVFAGIGHVLLHTNPVLGASGAVAAVTGAYLVLFPQTLITVLYWFIFIGTAEFSALWFIAFKLIFWDNVFEPNFSNSAIAYDAHLAGYAFGALTILLLLSTNLLERNYTDLFSMFKQGNRRRKYRDAVSGGYDPFRGSTRSKRVKAKQTDKPEDPDKELALEIRGRVMTLINLRNLTSAAENYIELVKLDSSQILSRDQQLEIANQLMSMGKWHASADAYEKMIAQYSSHEHIEQIQLMLGVLYRRYLQNSDLARKYLEMAKVKLTDESQKKMCDDELARLD